MPHVLAIASLLLTAAGTAYVFSEKLRGLTLLTLRLTWVAFLIPAISGIILLVSGRRVPSTVDIGTGLTRYGCPPDANRGWEHLMYAAFILLSLLALEALLKRGYFEALGVSGLRERLFVPLVALFLYGCAYMVGRVAILPGTSYIDGCM